MQSDLTPICFLCVHFDAKSALPFKCQAFPDGIPTEIIANLWDHTDPIAGDNGIQFEPTPQALAEFERSNSQPNKATVIQRLKRRSQPS